MFLAFLFALFVLFALFINMLSLDVRLSIKSKESATKSLNNTLGVAILNGSDQLLGNHRKIIAGSLLFRRSVHARSHLALWLHLGEDQ
jgi:hypothetical protein